MRSEERCRVGKLLLGRQTNCMYYILYIYNITTGDGTRELESFQMGLATHWPFAKTDCSRLNPPLPPFAGLGISLHLRFCSPHRNLINSTQLIAAAISRVATGLPHIPRGFCVLHSNPATSTRNRTLRALPPRSELCSCCWWLGWRPHNAL